MNKSCKYCGRIHDISYICPKKPQRKWHKNRQTKEKFRSTQVWQDTRRSIVFRDMGVCQLCLKENRYNTKNLEVHHITPLSEDFTMRLERTNLITLCAAHHKQADAGETDAAELRAIAEKNEEAL
ncbi:MAG: HNH endonuclease [Oscillospiraceae bacterium]|nr:HNH endonuclease [Oscillospiraceae bacterium]